MSNGVLGKSMSSANNNVTVYTVPATAEFATASFILTNMGATDATIKVAVGVNPTPSPADYVEFGTVIPANGGILERSCIVCSAGENIIVHSDSSDVAIRIHGLEK